MSLFRKIFIPKEAAQEVEELISYTVKWEVKTGWCDSTKVAHKVFVNNDDAKEFEKQLTESAKFLGCWTQTSINKN